MGQSSVVCVTLINVFVTLAIGASESYFELFAESKTLPGTSYFSSTGVASLSECCAKCDNIDTCTTISYNADEKYCLLSEETVVSMNDLVVSIGSRIFTKGWYVNDCIFIEKSLIYLNFLIKNHKVLNIRKIRYLQ